MAQSGCLRGRLATALLLVLALAWALPAGAADLPASLAGLRGPLKPTPPTVPADTDSQAFAGGGPHRLAILLTGSEHGGWLGLVEGLRALGVPITVTRDAQEAARHRMVIAYPAISGRVLDPEALTALRAVPQQGGTLLTFQVQGGAMATTFGIQDMNPARSRHAFRFDAGGRVPREAEIPLGGVARPDSGLWTFGYVPAGATVLAHFDSGEPALLDNTAGGGHAYALGVDAGDLFLRGSNNRQEGIARSYVNRYEPAADVLLHWIKERYREAEPMAVTLSGTPDGKLLPVMITHDLDYIESLRNAQEYLAFERAAGIRATYFLQTKYVRDWEDRAFLDPEGIGLVQSLARGGMEIGSHSVAHSRVFHRMDPGTSEEQYPAYHPVVTERFVCKGCSVSGEVRVSSFLIGQLTGTPPVSFRAGHLLNPTVLPETLVANGFRYGSDATANDLLTHLPVHAHYNRGSTAEVPLYEFPVTVEDEELPLLGDRVDAALTLADDVIHDEGIFMVLIHPNITGHKLRFERELVQGLDGRAWFGTVRDFGDWWAARDEVALDLQDDAANDAGMTAASAAPAAPAAAAVPGTSAATVSTSPFPADAGAPPQPPAAAHLHLHAERRIAGLTLQLPHGWQLPAGGSVLEAHAGLAVLAPFQGDLDLPLVPAGP